SQLKQLSQTQSNKLKNKLSENQSINLDKYIQKINKHKFKLFGGSDNQSREQLNGINEKEEQKHDDWISNNVISSEYSNNQQNEYEQQFIEFSKEVNILIQNQIEWLNQNQIESQNQNQITIDDHPQQLKNFEQTLNQKYLEKSSENKNEPSQDKNNIQYTPIYCLWNKSGSQKKKNQKLENQDIKFIEQILKLESPLLKIFDTYQQAINYLIGKYEGIIPIQKRIEYIKELKYEEQKRFQEIQKIYSKKYEIFQQQNKNKNDFCAKEDYKTASILQNRQQPAKLTLDLNQNQIDDKNEMVTNNIKNSLDKDHFLTEFNLILRQQNKIDNNENNTEEREEIVSINWEEVNKNIINDQINYLNKENITKLEIKFRKLKSNESQICNNANGAENIFFQFICNRDQKEHNQFSFLLQQFDLL
ncbi:hypothetical protein ABPG72_020837, partial [Tetrahymena utriculariae]